MTAKKKGRPPLPKGEAKSVILNFMVRPAEARELRRVAKEQGVSLSELLRSEVFRRLTLPA